MSSVQPPTSYLPPIARITTFTDAQLLDSLEYLKSLYRPEVRGSRRRHQSPSTSLAENQTPRPIRSNDGEDIQLIRSDAFERAYAIRWLTALIAQLEAWQQHSHSTPINPHPIDIDLDSAQPTSSTLTVTDDLIQLASSLLATCAGVASAGRVQRIFSFDSGVGRIEVSLTDIALENQDYESVGAQTWGGACVLAEMVAESPHRFGLGLTGNDEPDPARPFRVLELGAGTGLVGLTVARLLQALPERKNRPTTVVLTDFYPSVLDNLRSNVEANFPSKHDDDHIDGSAAISVVSRPLDWSSFPAMGTIPYVLAMPFDVVFGADVVYEPQHAVWIRDCLKRLLSHHGESSGLESNAFHLVIPLRSTHTFESSTVEAVFGWKDDVSQGSQRELRILSKESIVCEAYGDAKGRVDDDVEYVYYKIGWTKME